MSLLVRRYVWQGSFREPTAKDIANLDDKDGPPQFKHLKKEQPSANTIESGKYHHVLTILEIDRVILHRIPMVRTTCYVDKAKVHEGGIDANSFWCGLHLPFFCFPYQLGPRLWLGWRFGYHGPTCEMWLFPADLNRLMEQWGRPLSGQDPSLYPKAWRVDLGPYRLS